MDNSVTTNYQQKQQLHLIAKNNIFSFISMGKMVLIQRHSISIFQSLSCVVKSIDVTRAIGDTLTK
jgi:hypothetical protein